MAYRPSVMSLVAAQQDVEQGYCPESNVNAVGIGPKLTKGRFTGELAVVAFVTRKMSRPELTLRRIKTIPKEFLGVMTDVQEGGPYYIIPPPRPTEVREERWTRMRPAPGGVSCGGDGVTAGTLGMNVIYNKTGKRASLSNNHVWANVNKNPVGAPGYQPGLHDHGINDRLGKILEILPITFSDPPGYTNHPQKFDAALLEADNESDLTPDILDIGPNGEIGQIKGLYDANADPYGAVGRSVHKSSRTSFYDQGTITAVNSSVKVLFGPGEGPHKRDIGFFTHQIMFRIETQGGDSGTVVSLFGKPWEPENLAVALLFAGSSGRKEAIGNPMPDLFKKLDTSLIAGGQPPPPPDDIAKVQLTIVGPEPTYTRDMTKDQDGNWITELDLTALGGYNLRATAWSKNGDVGYSDQVIIEVEENGGHKPVKVEIIKPVDGQKFKKGKLEIEVKASYEGQY